MPRISNSEFERMPFRVHEVLEGVPLHDVWCVRLPRTRAGITLDDFLRIGGERPFQPSAVVRMLLGLRFFIGRLLGWDRHAADAADAESFASRVSAADQSSSLAPPGAPAGRFRVVYRFHNEQLLEVRNRTVHGAVFVALVETTAAYLLYVAIYVRSVGHLTGVYMACIDPVRRWIVYPSLERSVRATWRRTFKTSAAVS